MNPGDPDVAEDQNGGTGPRTRLEQHIRRAWVPLSPQPTDTNRLAPTQRLAAMKLALLALVPLALAAPLEAAQPRAKELAPRAPSPALDPEAQPDAKADFNPVDAHSVVKREGEDTVCDWFRDFSASRCSTKCWNDGYNYYWPNLPRCCCWGRR